MNMSAQLTPWRKLLPYVKRDGIIEVYGPPLENAGNGVVSCIYCHAMTRNSSSLRCDVLQEDQRALGTNGRFRIAYKTNKELDIEDIRV